LRCASRRAFRSLPPCGTRRSSCTSSGPYRLYKLPRPERNKPWKFKNLTIAHVYEPLARSSGKVLELTRIKRDQSGERWKKLHQFLSEIGVKVLRTQLGRLTGIAETSKDQREYERHVNRIFGVQAEWDFR
jgi:hypothetical protein